MADPQSKPAPVTLALNQICLLLANEFHEAPSSILCLPSYLSIFQSRTSFGRIHFTRFVPLRLINNKPHRQSIVFAVSALFNSVRAEFPCTEGNSWQVPNSTQESTKDGTEKWTQHSSDIQESLDKSLPQSPSYSARLQFTSGCNSLDSLYQIKEEATLWASTAAGPTYQAFPLPKLMLAFPLFSAGDGVGTGEESLLAGWKLLYGLRELIKPPVEQRGTIGECFCALCLKLTWEQGAGAQVLAPRAAGVFIQWLSHIHTITTKGDLVTRVRAATSPVPDAAARGSTASPARSDRRRREESGAVDGSLGLQHWLAPLPKPGLGSGPYPEMPKTQAPPEGTAAQQKWGAGAGAGGCSREQGSPAGSRAGSCWPQLPPKTSWGSPLKTHGSLPLSKEVQHLLLAPKHVFSWPGQVRGS